jgi:hypothetical protein
MKWLFGILFFLLVLFRLPSLAQPAGGDQGLYAYVAQVITHGGLPYRDAWDQKPPAIHYTYAAMFSAWPSDTVVAATDLLVALAVSILLVTLGRRLSGGRGPGEVAALLFLLLGNPALGRLGGMWVRSQCETFIALLVSGGLLLLLPFFPSSSNRRDEPPPSGGVLLARCLAAGAAFGLAFLYKYNAAVYLLVAGLAIALTAYLIPPQGRFSSRVRAIAVRELALALGFVVPVALACLLFVATGTFRELYQATIVYNLQYSGETYPGFWPLAWYLVTFPVQHASVDPLWLVGGLGCVGVIIAAARRPILVIVPAWVAAACLSIAINSGRGLPQYFVQAAPALALAAGLAAVIAWRALGPAGRVVVAAILVIGVARVGQFDKLLEATVSDARYLAGRIAPDEYLARFGGQRATDKFSALAVRDLGDYLRARTDPADRVLIFGFSADAYVRAQRLSASRFFWSRPIIVGFNEGVPGYGVAGLLADLRATRPKAVVLQQHDWPAERSDSVGYFMSSRDLSEWLRSEYHVDRETGMYQIWLRR